MARKKIAPSLFCEWVVGTTIPAALGPLPKKSRRRRGIVKIDITTDDETEQDTIRVTYPRSGKSRRHSKIKAKKDHASKQVRFEDTPKKPSLKSISGASSESDIAAEVEIDASTDATSSEETKSDEAKSGKGKKVKKENSTTSDSETEPEPHPTCDCANCARGRQKLQQAVTRTSKKGKEKTQPGDQSKGQKKGKELAESSDAESEDHESAKTTNDDPGGKSCKKEGEIKEKEKKTCKKPLSKSHTKEDRGIEAKQSESEEKAAKRGQDQTEHAEAKEGKNSSADKNFELQNQPYPSAFPGPHSRRLNLIQPIRAEVVQTERVIETPEDPRPNAYFDSENNIVRIYHGPVYGNHYQSLHPKHDPSHHPIPIGMTHPNQNPYYHGFGHPHEYSGLEHVPITQGMPVPAWNAFCQPAVGYPAGYPTAIWPAMEPNNMVYQGNNKGAFNLLSTAAVPPSSKDQDVAGGNNVLPPGKPDNPYIPKRSKFSNFGGSNRSASNAASPKHSKTSKYVDQNPSQPEGSEWGKDSKAQNAANEWGENAAPPADTAWGSNSNSGQNNSQQGNQDPSWNNNSGKTGDANTWGTWGNEGQTKNAKGSGGWRHQEDNVNGDNGNSSQRGNATDVRTWPSSKENHNNVMPGAWDTGTTLPPWGDQTMAASTGGKVDATSWSLQ